jgi:YaiO family outer membrane protein
MKPTHRSFGACLAVLVIAIVIVIVSCIQGPAVASASEIDSNLLPQARRAVAAQHYAAAESLLQQALQSNPADATARFLLARVYAWQRKFHLAITTYDQLLQQYPEHVDYLLGKAQTLVWTQRPRLALDLLAKARANAPDYESVWQLELKTLSQFSDPASRQQYRHLRALALQRFPDADWLATHAAVDNRDTQTTSTDVAINGKYDDLSNNLPSWHSYFITLRHNTARDNSYYGKLRFTNRFGLSDRELSAGHYGALNADWFFNVQAGISNTYRVLPHWFAYAGAGRQSSGGWNSQAGLRYRRYEFVDTRTVNVIIEKYWSAYRARYTLYSTAIDGDSIASQTELTHSLAIAYYYHASSYIGLSASKGKELEYDGSANALVSDIKNLSLSGRHWLSAEKWAINYLFEYQQQGTFYSRYGLRIGLLSRF